MHAAGAVAVVFVCLGEKAPTPAVKKKPPPPRRSNSGEGGEELPLGITETIREAVSVSRFIRNKRLWHLDFARVICAACIVGEHSGGNNYTAENIAWVQQWVLPYLYIISGMGFAISRASFLTYQVRLSLIFVVGTAANGIAISFTKGPSQMFVNLGFDTIFQMAYIPMLMLLSLVGYPLRQCLRWRLENPGAAATREVRIWVFVWVVGVCVPYSAFSQGWPWLTYCEDLSADSPCGQLSQASAAPEIYMGTAAVMLSQTFALILILHVGCWAGGSTLAAWIVLAMIYSMRVVIPYNRGAHAFNSDLFVFGMLIQQWTLHGSKTVVSVISEYWPLMVMTLLLLSMPDAKGRCDLHPMNTYWERFRFYTTEVLLVVAFSTGGMNTSDSHGLTGWLGMWALYAYCFHKAWDVILPRPYGALFTIFSAVFFYFAHRRASRAAATLSSVNTGETELSTHTTSRISVVNSTPAQSSVNTGATEWSAHTASRISVVNSTPAQVPLATA